MDKLTLLVLIGLPGSGKSTWAKKYCEENKNWVRINKDDIRDLIRTENNLSGDARVDEKEVIRREQALMFSAFFYKKLNVILDNTHLNPVHIKERLPKFLETEGFSDTVEMVVDKTFLDVSVEECIRRDALREGTAQVGPEVIHRMAKDLKYWLPKDYDSYLPRLQNYDGSKPKAVVFDLDGSVCLMSDRSPYDESKVLEDYPNIPVVNVCKLYLANPEYQVIFVSGRTDSCVLDTTLWLTRYVGVTVPMLYMRKTGDSRKDTFVKEDIYREYIEPFYFVECCFDDRVMMVDHWRKLGIFTFDLNQTRKEF